MYKDEMCSWHLSDWAAEESRKKKVANTPFTEDTKCVFVGGRLAGKVLTVAEIRKMGIVKGKLSDLSEWRANGKLCHSLCFDNAPTVTGYLGPMWGMSDCPFRYESQEVYDQLSK